MKTVTVNPTELLKVVSKNLETHKKDYKESIEGYYEEVSRELKSTLKSVKAGEDFSLNFRLYKPENHSADYERVIKMLEMTIEDEIELTTHEFDNFVMDNWSWSESFGMTKTMYASGMKG